MLRKNNRGITLIALVVTIIVLLILAGISISMLTGQNGILNRATEAKEKTETSSVDEKRKLAQAEALMNTERTTYKGVTLPEGFAPTKIDGEDSIDEGLVITDGYGNEYVWVEVPKTAEIYKNAGLGITEFSYEECGKIESDLKEYTKVYRSGTGAKDEYYNDGLEGWFKDEKEYNDTKNKMLKSVYLNKGFWISRYEAGSEKIKTSSSDMTEIPASKKNMYPYIFVTRTQAKILAEKVESGSCTSNLLFGVQWDLALKFIETKNENVNPKIQEYLRTNSRTIGNYYNAEIVLNRGKFSNGKDLKKWYDFNSTTNNGFVENSKKIEQSTGDKGVLLTTGASEETKLQNIYDMAGNVWEWDLEKSFNDSCPIVNRGGSYDYKGNYSASYRGIDSPRNRGDIIGFRIAIY